MSPTADPGPGQQKERGVRSLNENDPPHRRSHPLPVPRLRAESSQADRASQDRRVGSLRAELTPERGGESSRGRRGESGREEGAGEGGDTCALPATAAAAAAVLSFPRTGNLRDQAATAAFSSAPRSAPATPSSPSPSISRWSAAGTRHLVPAPLPGVKL